MIKIEITIPLRYNDGTPIEQTKLDKIRKTLLKEYKGLSISSEIEGYWVDNNITYYDFNKIYTVITDNKDTKLLSNYKKWLEFYLDQKEIFIVISEVKTI